MTRRTSSPRDEVSELRLRLWEDDAGQPPASPPPREAAPVRPVPARSPRPRKEPATDGVRSLEGLPLMLTVDEAAAVLRVSRTSAYKLVDEYRRSGGREGLPHVRLGGRLLVRRVDLAEIVGL